MKMSHVISDGRHNANANEYRQQFIFVSFVMSNEVTYRVALSFVLILYKFKLTIQNVEMSRITTFSVDANAQVLCVVTCFKIYRELK